MDRGAWWIPVPGIAVQFSSVQLLSHVQLFVTPWTTAREASLSLTSSQSTPKLMSIDSVMPSNHLILSCPLLLLPSIFPSIRVFSNESALCMRWPNYWSFSFSISPSNEHPGLITFRMDWLDLLQSKGLSESSPTPQFKSINSSVLSFLYGLTLTLILDSDIIEWSERHLWDDDIWKETRVKRRLVCPTETMSLVQTCLAASVLLHVDPSPGPFSAGPSSPVCALGPAPHLPACSAHYTGRLSSADPSSSSLHFQLPEGSSPHILALQIPAWKDTMSLAVTSPYPGL